MAINGTLDEVLETEQNRAHFGCPNRRTPFPQVRCAYLAECATHAIVAASLGPSTLSEEVLADELLASITPGMLVMMDRGLVSLWWANQLRSRQAHLLARINARVYCQPFQYLPDGSYLVKASRQHRHPDLDPPMVLRVIEYTLGDARIPSANTTCRLLTTLLDPSQALILELIRLYHERWEIESVLDEQSTHLRLCSRPFRAHTPQQVYQEIYGLLLTHYAIRHLMHESALEADLDPDQLSFSLAVEVISRAVTDFALWNPLHEPQLKARLLEDLREELLPPRRLRFQSRVVKRCESTFSSKRKAFHSFEVLATSFLDIVIVQRAFLI